MSAFDKFAKTAKDKLAKGGKVAMKSAGEALNKLDELGGEARDTVVEWWHKSPAMGSVREMLKRRQADAGSAGDEVADSDAAAPIVEADIVAASLGDPSVVVQVFGKRSCPWSGRAVRLLEDKSIEHTFVELDDPENSGYSSRLVAETKQNTVPYIFVRGQFIGGFNALDEFARLGKLADDGKNGGGRVKVEIAPRPNTDEVPPAEIDRPDGDSDLN